MRTAWFEYIPAEVARLGDERFFQRNPSRHFLARRYVPGDFRKLPPSIALFESDEQGNIKEANLVVVKRIPGGRLRVIFAVHPWQSLDDDHQITAFLKTRGIDPDTMKWCAHVPKS